MIVSNLQFVFTKLIPKIAENTVFKIFVIPRAIDTVAIPLLKSAIEFQLEHDPPESLRRLLELAAAQLDRGDQDGAAVVMEPMWNRDP